MGENMLDMSQLDPCPLCEERITEGSDLGWQMDDGAPVAVHLHCLKQALDA